MAKQLVLKFSENVYKQLQQVASSTGQSIEDWIKTRIEAQIFSLFGKKEREAAGGRIQSYFGIWGSGDSHSADNDRIDTDLAKEYADTHEEVN
jgi:hypothetical protein